MEPICCEDFCAGRRASSHTNRVKIWALDFSRRGDFPDDSAPNDTRLDFSDDNHWCPNIVHSEHSVRPNFYRCGLQLGYSYNSFLLSISVRSRIRNAETIEENKQMMSESVGVAKVSGRV